MQIGAVPVGWIVNELHEVSTHAFTVTGKIRASFTAAPVRTTLTPFSQATSGQTDGEEQLAAATARNTSSLRRGFGGEAPIASGGAPTSSSFPPNAHGLSSPVR